MVMPATAVLPRSRRSLLLALAGLSLLASLAGAFALKNAVGLAARHAQRCADPEHAVHEPACALGDPGRIWGNASIALFAAGGLLMVGACAGAIFDRMRATPDG